MIFFDTPIPPLLTCAWLMVAVAIAWFAHRKLHHLLRQRYRLGLFACRIVALLVVTWILLQPTLNLSNPDRSALPVRVLADVSGSMQTNDCRDADLSRLQVVNELLNEDGDNSLEDTLDQLQLEILPFTDQLRLQNDRELTTEPGSTAIGSVLSDLSDQVTPATSAAVLILSDGHINAGSDPIREATAFSAMGLPVSCIGIGERRQADDVTVVADEQRVETVKRQPVMLSVTVRNDFNTRQQVPVRFSSRGETLHQRNLMMEPGEKRQIAFETTPLSTGTQSYRIHAETPAGDTRPENDTAYVLAEVKEPPVFRVLYMAAEPDWNARFLRNLCRDEEQLAFSAVIRLDPETIQRIGLPEEGSLQQSGNAEEGNASSVNDKATTDGPARTPFPQRESFYNKFDCIVADAAALAELESEGIDAIRFFVGDRGGGLLCFGNTKLLPASIAGIMPMRQSKFRMVVRRQQLQPDARFIFDPQSTAVLWEEPGPFLPEDEPAAEVTDLKPAARTALKKAEADKQFLTVQQYGSGRVAYLGIPATWRWFMAGGIERERYVSFWSSLLNWLASMNMPRITTSFDGATMVSGKLEKLTINLLGPDFRPARNATIDAVLKTPDHSEENLTFSASAEAPGRFSAVFAPMQTGEYTLNLDVAFEDVSEEANISREYHFVAAPGGKEYADIGYRESTLRAIARVSGGTFVHYSDIRALKQLPLSNKVPKIQKHHNLAMTPWAISLLLLVLSVEWFLRRRIGLR